MDEILNELKSIAANARKKINQPYSKETIETKRNEIQDLEDRYRQLIDPTDQEQDDLLSKFEQVKKEAIGTLKAHIDRRNQKTIEKMTALNLNEISTIAKIIPIFNGRREDLDIFITNLKLVYATIEAEKRVSFFSFVFNSRLESKVRNRVKQNSPPTTVESLITALKTNYGPTKSANSLLNELTKVTQRNNNLSGFATKIESLVAELNEIQISEEGENNRSSIVSTNNRIAFNSFMNGLTDPQILATIDASQVKTFAEALSIAEKVDSRAKQGQVMYQTAGNSQNGGTECTQCGRTHGRRCPAEGKKCNKCGRSNHFANKCYSKNDNNRNNNNGNNNNRNNSNNRNDNRNNNNNRNNNRRNNYRNNNSNNNGNDRNRNGNTRNINHVQDQENYQDPETSRSGTPENDY